MSTGAKDMLVLPELNALVGVWPKHLTVEADVRDIPGIWVSADHQVPVTPMAMPINLFMTAPCPQLVNSLTVPDVNWHCTFSKRGGCYLDTCSVRLFFVSDCLKCRMSYSKCQVCIQHHTVAA